MLIKKIDFAKRLIDVAANKCAKESKRLEVAYSGGKDSDVLLWLAREVCGDSDILRPCYKNTTIDPPYTVKHAKEKGVEIIQPKKTFAEIIQSYGFPHSSRRFCCGYLKEYKIEDNALIGVRKAESTKREKLYKEPENCRVFSKKERVHQYYPLLHFSNQDIKNVVEHNNIQCHPLYYDAKGRFHVERRLGCMCCPLRSEKPRIAEFRNNPNMVKFYLRNGQKFLESKPYTEAYRKCGGDIYKLFYCNLTNQDMDNMLFELNYEQLIKEQFNLD